ncbi:hypothetical protein cyc_05586 [Cyclospora cayetanensis]|uniref:Obg domain-containing protein n=1 Tax=Cyclospora cayetanensis TaxID=88456 RepID=A0A1D3D191_9EIME|nr:hypothetical protein cyc_05586 [Cyclospora cayetanensis]
MAGPAVSPRWHPSWMCHPNRRAQRFRSSAPCSSPSRRIGGGMELASCDGRLEALPSNQIAADASVPGNPQVSPYRLLGGGLSLSPSLVFALGSRRLLEQQRKLAQEAHAGTAEASAAFTAEGTCTPVTVEGGSGGDGSVAFLRLRAAPRSGAAGGSGGRGGCVLLTAVSGPGEALADSKTSSSVRESGYWKAAPGVTGGGRGRTGCNGPDLVLGLSPNALVFDVSPLQARAASISGKSTLLQRLGTAASDCALGSAASVAADVHASFGSAASFTQPDDSAFRQAAEMQVDELKKQPQQWVSAAVPADVWLPTTEPTVCVIPCTAAEVPEAQQQAAQKGSVPQQEGGLLATLQEGVKLAATAPIVALDTPGLFPAPFAALDAAEGTEAQTDSLLPPETAPHETLLQGLSAATAVLVVVDGSLPEPAKAYLTVRQQLAHANPHLAQLPAILVLTKVDLLEQQEQEQGQEKLKATELVEMMKRETGIAEVHAVSDDPYKWSLVELPGQRTLEQLLNSRDLLQTAPDFESEDSTKNQRCFELRGPLVSLLTSPVRFSSEAAKLRLYRQLGALGIIERVYSDFSAKVGDYLLVGPVMLQLLPLLRNPKRRKKRSQQQELWSDDTWSFLHADGLPTKMQPGTTTSNVNTLAAVENGEARRPLAFDAVGNLSPSVRPFSATDHRAPQERRRARPECVKPQQQKVVYQTLGLLADGCVCFGNISEVLGQARPCDVPLIAAATKPLICVFSSASPRKGTSGCKENCATNDSTQGQVALL